MPEKIYVLYGSQTGNSEQAAKDFCKQAPSKLGNDVETVCLQLDDFLELERAAWSRLVVIYTSSYGVGQAPLGCYRFRDLCDAWLEGSKQDLTGVHFCLCGLGDSKYTTFFRNPTVIHDALVKVGATRVGPIGKADASGTGDNVQAAVIARWTEGIWKELKPVLAKKPPSAEALAKMQAQTVAICQKINPDFEGNDEKSSLNLTSLAGLVGLLLGILAYFFLLQTK